MATLKEQFGTASLFTITLASLGSGSWAQSTFVDNSANLFDDVFISLKVKTGATAAGTVEIWIYASTDGGTTFSDGATGVNGAFTPTATPNLVLLGPAINTPTATTTYISRTYSLAAAFGSNIPTQWGIAVHNTNGGILDATEGNFSKQYVGMTYQSV